MNNISTIIDGLRTINEAKVTLPKEYKVGNTIDLKAISANGLEEQFLSVWNYRETNTECVMLAKNGKMYNNVHGWQEVNCANIPNGGKTFLDFDDFANEVKTVTVQLSGSFLYSGKMIPSLLAEFKNQPKHTGHYPFYVIDGDTLFVYDEKEKVHELNLQGEYDLGDEDVFFTLENIRAVWDAQEQHMFDGDFFMRNIMRACLPNMIKHNGGCIFVTKKEEFLVNAKDDRGNFIRQDNGKPVKFDEKIIGLKSPKQ